MEEDVLPEQTRTNFWLNARDNLHSNNRYCLPQSDEDRVLHPLLSIESTRQEATKPFEDKVTSKWLLSTKKARKLIITVKRERVE